MKSIYDIGKEEAVRRCWDYALGTDEPRGFKKVRTITGSGNKVRINIVGLGDVGQNIALGLCMTGKDIIERIGLFDLNKAQLQRMETELSQIAAPDHEVSFPKVKALSEDELFDCDVFAFCATRGVPPVSGEIKDVRMAQYEANRGIVSIYARAAAKRNYRGVFLVVSDPVDLLCMEVLRSAWEGEDDSEAVSAAQKPEAAKDIASQADCHLFPDQIFGCGLGVMNARAAYYAGRNEEYSLYLKEGRAFGPHGEDLVIAISTDPARYDDKKSRELSYLTVNANNEVRAQGFKPFLAPAMSSGVLTILAMLNGEWNYSAAYLNGLFYGALNRQTESGTKWEDTLLPDALCERIERSRDNLEAILWDSH